ncbi:hypothetical protein Btru_016173 [Bulinus truncatus]|nr:hypothetical protein Btru_016173 [Bulinus truncatus]
MEPQQLCFVAHGLVSDREFILIYPPVPECRLFLFMFSMENDSVDVILSATGHFTPLLNHIFIQSGQLTKYEVPYLYRVKSESMVQPSMSLKSTKSFSMNVLSKDLQGCDSFLALPVSRFGQRYYVFTLTYAPFFTVITAAQSAEIHISLVNGHPSMFQTTLNNVLLKDGVNITVTIKRTDALYILNCSHTGEVGSLTGTRVESMSHIGVIAGNCVSMFQTTECQDQPTTTDFTAEMLLPADTYGKEFICFTITGRTSKSTVEVFAPVYETKVMYYQNENAKILVKVVGTFQLVVTTDTYLTAESPVGVYYIMPSKCPSLDEKGDPAIAVVTPLELYYYLYMFSTEWLHVLGVEYCVGFVKVEPGPQRAESKTFGRFGLMLYGLMPDSSFIQPVGMIVASIHQNCNSTMNTMVANDFIDNDCDGEIEEEFINFYDDDGDNNIDEDVLYLRELVRRFTANCTSQCLYCKSDCNKTTGKCDKHGCYDDSTEPECDGDMDYAEDGDGPKKPGNPNCSVGTHGDKCQFTCPNCLPDCNKLTGECVECQPGFVLLFKSCDIDCPDFTYGKNCSQDCVRKCQGLDCVDRVDGNCTVPEVVTVNETSPALEVNEETPSRGWTLPLVSPLTSSFLYHYTLIVVLLHQILSAQFGNHFLLMFPPGRDVRLYFYTSLLSHMKVTVVKENFKDEFVGQVNVSGSYVSYLLLDSIIRESPSSHEVSGAYSFRGNGKFAITVLLTSASNSGETFQAVPVVAFHIVYVIPVSIGQHYIICVTAVNTTSITVLLNPGPLRSAREHRQLSQNRRVLKYTLPRAAQSITIDSGDHHLFKQFPGCVISSNRPIGLIAGSYVNHDCFHKSNDTTTLAEMVLPVDYFGKEFIVFKMHHGSSEARLALVAGSSNIQVNCTSLATNEVEKYVLSATGASVQVQFDLTLAVVSSNPIGCYLVEHVTCTDALSDYDAYLSAAMLQFIPIEMFFNFYSWSKFDDWYIDINMSVVFVIDRSEVKMLTVKSQARYSIKWDMHVEFKGWVSGRTVMSRGVSHAWMTNFNFFGCYAVGVSNALSLAHPLGFQKSCIKGAHQDCDGYGDANFQSLVVDKVCPEKTYGEQCEKLCDNCEPDCDKVSGICMKCAIGYTNILNACRDECPSMSFGLDCTGDCAKKCKGDCLDRVQGSCRTNSEFSKTKRDNPNASSLAGLLWFFMPATVICIAVFSFAFYKRCTAPSNE